MVAGALMALSAQFAHAEITPSMPPSEAYLTRNAERCPPEIKSGMLVFRAESFGHRGSGFVTDTYSNMIGRDRAAGGRSDFLPAPLPQLAKFNGYRVMDCRSGAFLAIGVYNDKEMTGAFGLHDPDQLLATEFLRPKVQRKKPFTLADVQRAARALYSGRDVRILELRETEQTCACKELGGR